MAETPEDESLLEQMAEDLKERYGENHSLLFISATNLRTGKFELEYSPSRGSD